jgi:hypothetical protein
VGPSIFASDKKLDRNIFVKEKSQFFYYLINIFCSTEVKKKLSLIWLSSYWFLAGVFSISKLATYSRSFGGFLSLLFFKRDFGFPTQVFGCKLQVANSNTHIDREIAATDDVSKKAGFGRIDMNQILIPGKVPIL